MKKRKLKFTLKVLFPKSESFKGLCIQNQKPSKKSSAKFKAIKQKFKSNHVYLRKLVKSLKRWKIYQFPVISIVLKLQNFLKISKKLCKNIFDPKKTLYHRYQDTDNSAFGLLLKTQPRKKRALVSISKWKNA